MPPTALPDTVTSENLLSRAKPQAGQEDGPALGTAGGSGDGRDAAHQRRAVAEPPHPREDPHRRTTRWISRAVPASSTRRTRPQADLRRCGWGGEAPLWFYILKEAEIVGDGTPMARAASWARSAAASWPRSSSACCRHDQNSYLYLTAHLEARSPHSAGTRQVHYGRSSEVRRRLVLTNGGDELQERSRLSDEQVRNRCERGDRTCKRRSRKGHPPAHRPAGRSSRAWPWLQ